MPSLGLGEILVILVIALIVFGPRRLPEMGRSIGKSLREFRQAAADLRAEIESDLDEEPPRTPMRTPGKARRSPPDEDGPPRPKDPPAAD